MCPFVSLAESKASEARAAARQNPEGELKEPRSGVKLGFGHMECGRVDSHMVGSAAAEGNVSVQCRKQRLLLTIMRILQYTFYHALIRL